MKRATVFLVGAGPGDPGLITLRGLELIRKADVVVYDHLVDLSLLNECKKDCELVYVGKEGGAENISQERINALLVEKAKEGGLVVRLKGGDPFLFGRGGEEAEHLLEHGIAFEVVPGVTSAIAAPAYAGIPVTHRRYSSSIAVITGHEDPTKGASSHKWESLAVATDTLVILMGMKNLEEIVQRLLEQGRDPETPAAVIQWGTLPRQKVVTGKLRDLPHKARSEGLTAPAVTIVGDVVLLRDKLAWAERKPLWGRRILVTRAREQASKLSALLKDLGGEVAEFPTISFEPIADSAEMEKVIEGISQYDWVVFTSPNGVRFFREFLWKKGRDARALGASKIAAIGPGTEEALLSLGLRPDKVPNEFSAEGLVGAFNEEELLAKKVLLLRAQQARDVLPEALREMGAEVKIIPLYRTVVPKEQGGVLVEKIKELRPDIVTFTSSSTVNNMAELAGNIPLYELLKGVKVACIGPITMRAARRHGLQPQIVASTFTIQGLVEAIVAYVRGEGARL